MPIPLAKPLVPDRHVAVTITSPDLPMSFTHSVPTADVEDVLALVDEDFLARLAETQIGVTGRHCFRTHSLVGYWISDTVQDAFACPEGPQRQALLARIGPVALWSAFTHPHFATEMRCEVAKQLYGPAGKANILVVFASLANPHPEWAFCVVPVADDPASTVSYVLDQLSDRLGRHW